MNSMSSVETILHQKNPDIGGQEELNNDQIYTINPLLDKVLSIRPVLPGNPVKRRVAILLGSVSDLFDINSSELHERYPADGMTVLAIKDDLSNNEEDDKDIEALERAFKLALISYINMKEASVFVIEDEENVPQKLVFDYITRLLVEGNLSLSADAVAQSIAYRHGGKGFHFSAFLNTTPKPVTLSDPEGEEYQTKALSDVLISDHDAQLLDQNGPNPTAHLAFAVHVVLADKLLDRIDRYAKDYRKSPYIYPSLRIEWIIDPTLDSEYARKIQQDYLNTNPDEEGFVRVVTQYSKYDGNPWLIAGDMDTTSGSYLSDWYALHNAGLKVVSGGENITSLAMSN